MSYVTKVLLPGERVIYETGLHWLVYWRAILLLAAAAALAIGATRGDPVNAFYLLIPAGILAALGAIALIWGAIRRGTTELAVTDQRVVFKEGLFSRHTIEMNRSKVESVDVDQSIFGRILGYGTVQLRGTGGSLDPMPVIAHPLVFRSHITAEPVRPAEHG